jgi:hypothetical protein
MKLIAHRGLYKGPDINLENKPEQICTALGEGYDCEIDLRVIDSKFFLGHDRPDYEVDEKFLTQPGLWIHAKNLQALRYLSETNLAYFWHQNDDCVITSNGYIWTYPEKELTDRSIRLMPEWANPTLDGIESTNCYAICSDYVELIKTKFEVKFQRDVVLDLIG